jgi:Rha family phage regulatory protein
MQITPRENMELPALCVELRLKPDHDGTPVVNSRDVAEAFEKRHDHVLRDIDAIRHAPDLGHGWFREVQSEHPAVTGRFDRSFDLTRQGFTLLVMGWNGERAMQFKVRYIQAFDAMETMLKANEPTTHKDLIQAIREIVAPLAVRFDGQDVAIEHVAEKVERVETKVDGLNGDVVWIKNKLSNKRRDISPATKVEHIDAADQLGGRCPCGCARLIVVNGIKLECCEFDHFYDGSKPDINNTWPLHKQCHSDLTHGKVPRHEREPAFKAYHNARRRLPGRQKLLF